MAAPTRPRQSEILMAVQVPHLLHVLHVKTFGPSLTLPLPTLTLPRVEEGGTLLKLTVHLSYIAQACFGN